MPLDKRCKLLIETEQQMVEWEVLKIPSVRGGKAKDHGSCELLP